MGRRQIILTLIAAAAALCLILALNTYTRLSLKPIQIFFLMLIIVPLIMLFMPRRNDKGRKLREEVNPGEIGHYELYKTVIELQAELRSEIRDIGRDITNEIRFCTAVEIAVLIGMLGLIATMI